jgi:predicted O-linked N-acetylglucosamine transferase (SPINDLY family)
MKQPPVPTAVSAKTTAPSAGIQRRFEQAFALHAAGRTTDALRLYEAVLAESPRHAPSLHFSALLLHQAGRSDDAIARLERSLAIDDGVSDVWSNAGLVYTALGRVSDAARALERALRLEPTLTEAWVNLAALRVAMDDPVVAEGAARRALALAESPRAAFNLALSLTEQRRSAEALEVLQRLEAGGQIDPADVTIPALRAQLLVAVGQRDAARTVLDRALARGDAVDLRVERARLADARRDHDAAIADYEAALRLDPDHEPALSELIFLKKQRASWDGLPGLQSAFRARVARHARAGEISGLTPFSFLSDPSSRAEQRAAAAAWALRDLEYAPSGRPLSTGRLRIGYLSADLHEHATGVLTVGLFEQHDRARFEVFAYSTGPDDGSALRRRLVGACDRFVDARGWSDERIATAIRDDAVDVLVDLKGYTERATTGVMARRPAPIAVSYLGYPGTMGASFIDYLIGDAVVTPLAHADDYSETLVHLPHSYQVNDDRRTIAAAPTREALGLPQDAVVFCCFNNVYKITPDVFDAWVDILLASPRSVLWLLTRADDDTLRNQLRREAASRGLDPQRIVFGDTRVQPDYLALYRRADLFLDTWPYNAHTTASDALLAGCPVLTFLGETFAGRVAASLLTAVGLTEGIARDRADYVARAIAWAADRDALVALRGMLERDVRASPLFDTKATTRAIEAAYLAMAAQHGAGRHAPIVIGAA